jgi:predicted alpha/beta-fold hydrolase
MWARSGHAQTLLGHLIPSPRISVRGERIEVPLPDGDRLVGFYFAGKSGLAVALFHGLSGTSDADYFHRTAKLCFDRGHSVFMFNHRGCGAGAGLAIHPYHSGRAEDLSAALEFARKKEPGSRQVAIGFSLSGNALLLLLSGKRGTTKPDAGISVNAPIDLESAGLLLKRGLNRIYDLRFVRLCKAEIAGRRRADPKMAEYKISAFSTLRDFDKIYTAPASGFLSREDYYSSCSTKNLLTQIDRPTVLLTAKDDPFVDYRNYLEARLSPQITLHIENVGGHMGYLSARKTPLGTNRWQDYALDEAIKQVAG